MKKPIIMISLIAVMLIITACGGSSPKGQTQGDNPNQPGSSAGGNSNDTTKYLDTNYTNALPLATQLIVGTLKLKGTTDEVDAATAKELIPLWKAAKTLGSSDTTAPQEMEGLYRQIQRTMTPEQLAAIADMKLSRDNMMQISQDLGISLGGAGGMGGSVSAEQKATMEANRSSNNAPTGGGMMGGPGGGPGGGMMGGGPPGQNSSSSGTSVAGAPQVSQIDTNLVDALINYLESRIQQ